jgi:hypothetical protein
VPGWRQMRVVVRPGRLRQKEAAEIRIWAGWLLSITTHFRWFRTQYPSASTGDCTASGDICNGVFYASISNSGTIGSWASTTSFSSSSPTMPACQNRRRRR